MKKSLTILFLLFTSLLVPVSSVSGVAGFGDVEADRFYTKPVQWMIDEQIINTGQSSCFAPDIAATRGDTALYMWRMQQQPEAPVSPFTDIVGEDYNAAVSWMFSNAITTGKGATTFAPGGTLTRGEVAAFLYRLEGSPQAGEHPFTDVTASWQQQPIAWMANRAITRGTSDTTFSPNDLVNRGELATFLYRYKGQPQVTVDPISPSCNEYLAVSSGGQHSCALRSDQTAVCWGANNFGESDPPSGQFNAISAGSGHTCGLRLDNTVTCWGRKRSAPPDGQFNSLSSGLNGTCGVRQDNTLACWPSRSIPNGEFLSVSHGSNHSCAIRADSTVVCWHHWDEENNVTAPEGTFITVSAGGVDKSCGVRRDNTIVCWGGDREINLSIPHGQYSTVTVGGAHNCGLRFDQTVACWGFNSFGQTDVPDGEFVEISSAGDHTCAVRVDKTITCWGLNYADAADAPIGQFYLIEMGAKHSCGVRVEKTVTCWGLNNLGQADPPQGQFNQLAVGIESSCGLRTDNTVTCWGANGAGQLDAPSGHFNSVAFGNSRFTDRAYCGLRQDQSITCWGANARYQEPNFPRGMVSEIAPGGSCGLRPDKTVTCWGGEPENNVNVPSDEFSSLATNRDAATCGIRVDMTVACWTLSVRPLEPPPVGQFSAITVNNNTACGLRTNRSVQCWHLYWPDNLSPPTGQFDTITSGAQHTCGLRTDATITCWGFNINDHSLEHSPTGTFKSVSASGDHTCAIGNDNTITCWGTGAPPMPMPDDVSTETVYDAPNPQECRPYGASLTVSAGFPRIDVAPNLGTLRVAVLYVDFPDAVAEHSTEVESQQSLLHAERYLEAMSYGQLNVEFTPVHEWLRVRHPHQHYLTDPEMADTLNEEAVQLASDAIDITDHDTLLVVMPSTHFFGGTAGGLTDVRGTVGLPYSHVNNLSPSDGDLSFFEVDTWGHVAAHEIGHNLGLADLYDVSGEARVNEPPGNSTRAEWGLMGLDVWLSPAYKQIANPREMLAWSRWQLGWLQPSEIRCVTEPEATVRLAPVAQPNDGTAMAAIPISGRELVVIESRRRIGYDAVEIEPGYDLALPPEGVLVYTVDTTIGSGDLPIKPANETREGFNDELPFLTEGESTNIGGYQITLESDDGETHMVHIARSNR
ncbi:MAG: S-layer homology domain-containing protein [Acidimicrobiia bacterium]|nr:S-layer homology domain-containing protein [Acidimicrobiia bacterium]